MKFRKATVLKKLFRIQRLRLPVCGLPDVNRDCHGIPAWQLFCNTGRTSLESVTGDSSVAPIKAEENKNPESPFIGNPSHRAMLES
jgi:hypothetical protein